MTLSGCMHFFNLPDDPVMVRKIKPQSTQRVTESCYFSLSPPLCSSCSLWFSETLFRKYQKVFIIFGNRNARCQRSIKLMLTSYTIHHGSTSRTIISFAEAPSQYDSQTIRCQNHRRYWSEDVTCRNIYPCLNHSRHNWIGVVNLMTVG